MRLRLPPVLLGATAALTVAAGTAVAVTFAGVPAAGQAGGARAAQAGVRAGNSPAGIPAARPPSGGTGGPAAQVRTTALAGLTVAGKPPVLAWPAGVQGAIAVGGIGWLSQVGPATSRPIASVAKIMTAYQVLLDHPLLPGADGPTILVRAADVARFHYDVATGQSTVPVALGEHLSERQALSALLLPSANNVATLLARWDAGSVAAFVARMNSTARSLGLHRTRYAGPSGFNAHTVSTASDQVSLTAMALQNPTFTSIVDTPAVVLPVAGLVHNVNRLLGHDGIIGVKTGTSAAAGACLVFASVRQIAGRRVVLIGALLGSPRWNLLSATFSVTQRLLASAAAAVTLRTVLPAGATVGTLRMGGAAPVPLHAATAVRLLAWPGLAVQLRISDPLKAAGGRWPALNGVVEVGYQQAPLKLTGTPPAA
jgi:D-alanyl-D-alanine carboxypeptidase (penicillin-binding protein 5/6)